MPLPFLRQRDPPPDVVIPPRASLVANDNEADPPTVWNRHVRYITDQGRIARQPVASYGRRSLVDTTIGRYEHVIGPKQRARSVDSQQGEIAHAVSLLNRTIQTGKPVSVRASSDHPQVG